MSTVILAEKPSVAKDIARLLGRTGGGEGYIDTRQGTITWAIGHLVELAYPEEYDPAWQSWDVQTLPIIPPQWRLNPVKEKRSQYRVIINLLKKASMVVIATDAGREGELIARELMELAHYRGPVRRLWTSSMDDESLKKAWGQLLDSNEKIGLYHAARCRQRADWLTGINLTRAATKVLAPPRMVFSVGRVQTPTLAMVVRRDLEIENFKPREYFELLASVQAPSGRVMLRYAPSEENRLWERGAADRMAQQVNGARGPLRVRTERKRQGPPRLFALSDLQAEANRRLGYTAQQTLDIAQSLYEQHKAITYPRSDSRYLPEEQINDAPHILAGLHGHQVIPMAIPDRIIRKGTFNTTEVNKSDHHAIVPTRQGVEPASLSPRERAIYDLVALRYAAQFLPDYEHDQTHITMDANGVPLAAKGSVPVIQGWKELYPKGDNGKRKRRSDEEMDDSGPLPPIRDREPGTVDRVDVVRKQTQPPKRYTEALLLEDMSNIQKYVTEERLRRILKETSGIGTQATRASIIETLKRRTFLRVEKKHLISTESARALIAALPPALSDAGLTAVWEDYLESIAKGERQESEVMQALQGQMQKHLDAILGMQRVDVPGHSGKAKPTSEPPGPAPACPGCGSPMVWRTSRFGDFWGCSGYPKCKAVIRPDGQAASGRPAPAAPEPDAPLCPKCGKPMRRRNGPRGPFWGCSGYPKCRHIVNIEEGAG